MKKNGKLSWRVSGMLLAFLLAVTSAAWAETDVTAKVQLVKGTLGYDRLNKQSYQNVLVKNISQGVLLTPIKVVIDSVTPSTVTVANADGVTEDSKPYLSFTTTTGQLLPGATTAAKKLIFANPTAVKFTYTTHVEATIPNAAEVIGPAGGVMEATDPASSANITVEFPPGALAANQTFTIDTSSPTPEDIPSPPVGPVINLGPSGTFQEPVTITISYDDSQLTQSNIVDEASLRIYTLDESTGIWLPLSDALADTVNNTVSATTTHFSTFCVLGNTLVGHGELRTVQQAPVLFVHGIKPGLTKKSYIGDCYKTFGNAIESLYSEGLNVFALNYDTSVDITRTAKSLALAIEKIRGLTSATHVNVIAHSMGGLVSRAYIQGIEYQEEKPFEQLVAESTPSVLLDPVPIHNPNLYHKDIAKLLMMGTPNNGAIIANIADFLPLNADTYRQMSPGNPFLNVLNSSPFPSSPNDIILNVAYGDGGGDGDGIVSIESARFLLSLGSGANNFRSGKEDLLTDHYHVRLIRLGWMLGVAEVNTNPPELHKGYQLMRAFVLDADNDGVTDRYDACPGTSLYTAVNANGCPATEAPLAPVKVSPLNGKLQIPPMGETFKWTASVDNHNFNGNPLQYCITVKEDGMETPVVPGCDQRIFTTATETKLFAIDDGDVLRIPQEVSLKKGTKYWWAVWAVDSDGNWSPSSEWWGFTTDKDSDADGVDDSLDLCSGTNPFDNDIDVNGCTPSQLKDIDQDGDGLTPNQGDCDDNNPNIKSILWYQDADGDGYGNANLAVHSCTQVGGHVADNTDCNDANASLHAITAEVCGDNIDQDCNGSDLACPTVDLNDGLVAYYPFNGNANDASGNGNKGTVSGSTLTSDRFDNTDSAYSFDGVDDRIAIGSFSEINNDMSISFFIKPNASEPKNVAVIQSKYHYHSPAASTQNSGYAIYISNNSTSQLRYRQFSEDTFQYEDIIGDTSFNIFDGSWHMLTFVKQGHEGYWYIDGQKYSEGNLSPRINFENSAYHPESFIGVTKPICISCGDWNYGQEYFNWYKGDVDNVRFYNRALSDVEIQALYNEADNGQGSSLTAPAITFSDYDPTQCRNYITWTDEGAFKYHVYWGTSSGVTTGSESMPLTPTHEYGHTGVVPGWPYFYRVASVAADGTESALSEEVEVPVPVDAAQCFSTVTSAGQVWMDRNLGASREATSYNDPEAYGDLYQWGRGTDGHEKRNSPITSVNSSTDNPGHGSFITESSYPYDWRIPQNNNLWQGESGINNPCPDGFRLPTYTELDTERLSWASNNSAGAFASPLKLVVGGYRNDNGTVNGAGSIGYYWSSTVLGVSSRHLYFYSGSANLSSYTRAYGYSARCLED